VKSASWSMNKLEIVAIEHSLLLPSIYKDCVFDGLDFT